MQLRWYGHIIRMADERMPKHLFNGELSEGKYLACTPEKKSPDNINANLMSLRMVPNDFATLHLDRARLRRKEYS